MANRQVPRVQTHYSIDDLAIKIAGCLLEDFRPFLSGVNVLSNADTDLLQDKLKAGVIPYREECSRLNAETADLHVFKRVSQIKSLFKKYIFQKDMYTPIQVAGISEEKFLLNQARLNVLTLSVS